MRRRSRRGRAKLARRGAWPGPGGVRRGSSGLIAAAEEAARTFGRPTSLARLPRRVFGADIDTCQHCGGRMKVLKVAAWRADIDAALFELGDAISALPSGASPAPLAQLELVFD